MFISVEGGREKKGKGWLLIHNDSGGRTEGKEGGRKERRGGTVGFLFQDPAQGGGTGTSLVGGTPDSSQLPYEREKKG